MVKGMYSFLERWPWKVGTTKKGRGSQRGNYDNAKNEDDLIYEDTLKKKTAPKEKWPQLWRRPKKDDDPEKDMQLWFI